jgi:proline iminopeptidase
MKNRWVGAAVLAGLLAIVLSSCGSKSLTPGEGYVDVTGGKVWYRIVGSGNKTPLLVLHGGPGVPSYYLKPLAALADERPVVFYDQLGCGHSTAPNDSSLWTIDRYVQELGQVRKALGLNEVYLYGHSWGTILAAEYLFTHPSGVKGCVMSSPALSIPRWQHGADSLLTTMPDSIQQVIRENEAAGTVHSDEYQAAMMAFYAEYLARRQPWSADIDSAFMQMNPALYEYMNGPSEFNLSGILHDYDCTDRLNEITIPTLFISGDNDEAPASTVRYYSSLVPNSEMVIVPDAGHLTMQDNPEVHNRAVRAFLDKVDAR